MYRLLPINLSLLKVFSGNPTVITYPDDPFIQLKSHGDIIAEYNLETKDLKIYSKAIKDLERQFHLVEFLIQMGFQSKEAFAIMDKHIEK